MKTLVRIGLLLSLGLSAIARDSTLPLRIDVLVYNYALVPDDRLAEAERQVAGIYRRAGVETEWQKCLPLPQGSDLPSCKVPASGTWMALRLYSKSASARLGLTRAIPGSACGPKNGKFLGMAQVCTQCIERLAAGDSEMQIGILGRIIAHEMGHLFLGVIGHSRFGLMKARMETREFTYPFRGDLDFTASERKLLRQEIDSRSHAQR